MRSSASSLSSACCRLRIARCKRYAIRAGLVCLLLLAAVGPVAAQDEEPLRGAQAIVDAVPAEYDLLAESAHLELYIHPRTAQIAVHDLRVSRVWLSNPVLPDREQIAEKPARHLRLGAVCASPRPATGLHARRMDTVNEVSEFKIEPAARGATVRYTMKGDTLAFDLRYELGADYLDVAVEESGLVESDESRLVALDILPYLGATPYRAETSAYLVLPDGPGSLTYIGGSQPSYRQVVSVTSYGPDRYSFARPSEQRTPLASFGIVHPAPQGESKGGMAVLGVVTARRGRLLHRGRDRHIAPVVQLRQRAPELPQPGPGADKQRKIYRDLSDRAHRRRPRRPLLLPGRPGSETGSGWHSGCAGT